MNIILLDIFFLAWPKIVVSFAVLVVTCIVLVKFTPIDRVIDNVLPDFNTTNDRNADEMFIDNDGDGDYDDDNFYNVDDDGLSSHPVTAPTLPPFSFMQCTSYEDGKSNYQSMNQCCNGLDTICDLSVTDVMFATVHNAMSTFQDGFIFGANHRYSLEGALEAGYRGLHFIVCNCGTSGDYVFCNDNGDGEADCRLGSRDIHQTMTNVNAFLNRNPSEVLFINFQLEPNVDLTVLHSILHEIVADNGNFDYGNALTDKLYVHDDDGSLGDKDWPSLRKLVDENKVNLFL